MKVGYAEALLVRAVTLENDLQAIPETFFGEFELIAFKILKGGKTFYNQDNCMKIVWAQTDLLPQKICINLLYLILESSASLNEKPTVYEIS